VTEETVVDTPSGPVAYREEGEGPPVLFVHGSPGGSDQGLLMGRFLAEAGNRVVAPSRPGYLATPLREDNGSAGATAECLAGLMGSLGAETFGVVCWSGGGPSSYHLAAAHPDRVRALVACAAVSGTYTFATGVASIESSLMSSGLGGFVLHTMAEHAPKSLIASTVKEEGKLSRTEAKELTEHIWDHEDKRDFVLALSATLSGRRAGGQFRLGSKVRVVVAHVDVDRRQLDFRLVGSRGAGSIKDRRGAPAKPGAPSHRPRGKPAHSVPAPPTAPPVPHNRNRPGKQRRRRR